MYVVYIEGKTLDIKNHIFEEYLMLMLWKLFKYAMR